MTVKVTAPWVPTGLSIVAGQHMWTDTRNDGRWSGNPQFFPFSDRPELLGAVLLTPLYWILMSIASVRAAIQLVVDPFHWEKTAHGLGATPEVAEEVIDLTWPEDVIDLTGVASRR